MDEARAMLNDPALDPILRNLTLSRKKWTEIQAELFELGSSTQVSLARKALIEKANSILKYDSNNNQSDLSISDGDMEKVKQFVAMARGETPQPSNHQYGKLLRILFIKLSTEEDWNLIEKLSNIASLPGFDADKGTYEDLSDDLTQFCKFVLEENNSIYYLLLIKLILVFLNESIPEVGKVSASLTFPKELSLGAALSADDIKAIGDQMTEIEHMRNFTNLPHPFPYSGVVTRCTSSEISGKVAGIVAGYSLANYPYHLVYHEITIKLKDVKFKNIRLGFASRDIQITGSTSLGARADSWVLDVATSRFLHNSGIIDSPDRTMSGISSDSSVDSSNDFDDGFFGNLFAREEDITASTGPSAAIVEPISTNIDTLPTVSFGMALEDAPSPSSDIAVKNDSVIGILLDLDSGYMEFFNNGIYIGQSPVPIDSQTLQSRSLVPVFSVGTAYALAFNVGQSEFSHLRSVLSHVARRDLDSLQAQVVDATSKFTSLDSCLALGKVLEDRTIIPGWIHIQNNLSDGFKYYTMELAVQLDTDASSMTNNPSNEEYGILTCGPTMETLLHSSCPEDRGCRLSVTAGGAVCFEVSGGEKVRTPAGVVVAGRWYYLSVVYIYHRSSDKATVQIFIGGVSLLQADLVNKSNSKVGKIAPRHMLVGSCASPFVPLRVCDIRFWGCSRGIDRLAANAKRGKVFGAESDLVMYLPCDEASGGVVHSVFGPNTNRRAGAIPVDGAFHWTTLRDSQSQPKKLKDYLNELNLSGDDNSMAILQDMIRLEQDTTENGLCRLLLSISQRMFKTSTKLLRGMQANDMIAQKLLDLTMSTSVSASVLSPSESNFLLIKSILGQLISIMNTQRNYLSVYPLVVEMLLRLLRINIRALQVDPDLSNAIAESSLGHVRVSLFNLLLCLINGCKYASSQEMEMLRSSALDILSEYLSFFVISPSNRFKLLEVLLQAQCVDIHDIKAPQLKRAVSNFKAEMEYLQQERAPTEPLRALLSLPCPVARLVIQHLAQVLSNRNVLKQFIPSYLVPRTTTGLTVVRARSADITPSRGVFVKRGPDWRYGDEDGGDGSLGIVIDIFDWKSQKRTGLLVAWKNGHIDGYRFGVEESYGSETSSPSMKTLYDVEILSDERSFMKEQVAILDTEDSLASSAPSASTSAVRRELQYTPRQVMEALLPIHATEASSQLTRRGVLQYIKDHSGTDWQIQRKINKAVNNILKEMSSTQLVCLYLDFYVSFSSQWVAAVERGHELDNLDRLLMNMESTVDMSERVRGLCQRLLQYLSQFSHAQQADPSCDQILTLLQAIQLYLLKDASKDTGGGVVPSFQYNSLSFDVKFTLQSKPHQWDWSLGKWVPCTTLSGATDNAEGSSLQQTAAVRKLYLLNVDLTTFDSNSTDVVVRRRSKCTDITRRGAREWATIMMDTAIAPNTGVYVWYFKFKIMSERKSHFMVGLATKDVNKAEYLGQNSSSCGLSQGFDFYYASRKQRWRPDAPSITTGSILQVTYDSSQGTLLYALVNDDEVFTRRISKDCLGDVMSEQIVYPALSLFSPGDVISVMHNATEIAQVEERIQSYSSETSSKPSNNNSSGSASSGSMSWWLGSPAEVVIHYVQCYGQQIIKIFRADHVVMDIDEKLIGGYLHLLASLALFSCPAIGNAEKLLADLVGVLSHVQGVMNAPFERDGVSGMSTERRTKVISIAYQISSLLIVNINKLVHVLVRADQWVPYNALVDGTISRRNGDYDLSKKSIISTSKSKIFRNGVRNGGASTIDGLLTALQNHDPALERVFEWLTCHNRAHRNYRVFGGEELDHGIKLSFLTILYHSGLAAILIRTSSLLLSALPSDETNQQSASDVLRALKPPSFLMAAWDAALSLRLWARDVVSSASMHTRTYGKLGEEIVEKASALMSFESCYESRPVERQEDSIQGWLSYLQVDSRCATIYEQLVKEVSNTFKHVLSATTSIYPFASISKEITSVAMRRQYAFKHIVMVLNSLSEDISGALKLLFADSLRYLLKGKRLTFFSTVSESSDMISELKSSSTAWHYLTGLETASRSQINQVQAAFNTVMTALVSELSCNSEAGGDYQFALLDLLAIRVEDIDHELLARTNVFFAIQELLDEFMGKERQDAMTSDGSQPVVTVAIKLFILLGLQVASSTSPDDSPTRITFDQRSLPYLELRKVKSGPATLSKAVFDIVYSLLKDTTDSVMIQAGRIRAVSVGDSDGSSNINIGNAAGVGLSKESLVVVNEAMSLLLCVTSNAECVNILKRPKWLHLLLDMSAYGLGPCRPRALQLLGDILSDADREGLTWSCLKDHPGHFRDNVIDSLLLIVGDAALNEDQQASILRNGLVEESNAVIAHGVNLIRKLLQSSVWAVETATALEDILCKFITLLQSNQWDVILGKQVLAILFTLGGQIDGLYRGCPVVFRPSTNEDFYVGVIQSFHEDSTDQVDVLVFKLSDGVFGQGEGSAVEDISSSISSMLLNTAYMQPVHAFRYVTLPAAAQGVWHRLVMLLNEFFTDSNLKHDVREEGGKGHIFFWNVLKIASLKALGNHFLNPHTDVHLLVEAFSTNKRSMGTFLQKLLAKAIKPSIYGGLNELPAYERHLDALLRYQKRIMDTAPARSPSKSAGPSTSSDSKDNHQDEARTPMAAESRVVSDELDALGEEEEEEEKEDHEGQETQGAASELLVEELVSMGFNRDIALLALTATRGDVEEALNYILSNETALHNITQGRRELSRTPSRSQAQLQQQTSSQQESNDLLLPSLSPSPPVVMKYCHYDGDRHKLLPLYAEPSLDAERIGCVFPGDDLGILEERIVDGRTWHKLFYSDFDDGNLHSSYGEEMHNVFVWIPHDVDGEEVVKGGAYEGEGDGDLTEPPSDSLRVDKYYRIIGSNGATVRTGREISSQEVCTLTAGETVHAYLETINFDGTLRLQIDYPVNGWISKNLGLVQRIEPDAELLAKLHSAEPLPPSADARAPSSIDVQDDNEYLRKLMDLEDSMEILTGVDAFSKEDRFFGQLQGMTYLPLPSRSKRVLTIKPNRLATLKSTLETSKEAVPSVNQDRFQLIVAPMLRLLSRKVLLILMLRSVGPINRETYPRKESPASATPSSILMALLEEAQSMELDSSHWSQLADHLVRFLRLIIFRGDPTISYGIEESFYEGLARYAVNSSDLCIEEVVFESLVAFFQLPGEQWKALDPVRCALERRLLYSVAASLSLACVKKFSDHSWADTSYADDGDEEIPDQPNLHFILWVVNLFIYTRNVKALMSSFNLLSLSMKFTSMSLKCLVFKSLSAILRYARMTFVSKEDLECLEAMLSRVPRKRLEKFAARRMRQEMEDSPAYSRFLQALLSFLGEMTVAGRLIGLEDDRKGSDYRPLSKDRSILTFSTKSSHVKLLPGKDLTGSWTLETWICRQKKDIEEYEAELSTESSAMAKADSLKASNPSSRMGFTGLLQMLLGTARDNLAAKGLRSSEGEGAETTKDEESTKRASTEQASQVDNVVKKASFLHPSYLLQSSKLYVKLQKGGRVFKSSEVDDPMQEKDPIPSESFCLSIGQTTSDVEKSFDCVIPVDQWLHLAIVHDSVGGSMSVYLDGKLVDTQPLSMALPLGAIGSMKGSESFLGSMAELRIWSHVKTELEIKRDMYLDVRGRPLAHFTMMDCVEDDQGFFHACTPMDCIFAPIDIERISSLHLAKMESAYNSRALRLAVDSEIPSREFTGMIKINRLGKKGPLASGLQEILTLTIPEEAFEGIAGESFHALVDWCDRNVKVEVEGRWKENEEIELEYRGPGGIVLGPPEKMQWLQRMVFKGRLVGSTLEGSVDCTALVESTPPPAPGRIRLDTSLSAKDIRQQDNRIYLEDGDEGQYLAMFEVSPHAKIQGNGGDVAHGNIFADDLPWGLLPNQGSLWLEYDIVHNSGNIAFGLCTSEALVHPDASVDANDGAFTYNTAGTASHGGDLHVCDHADSGEKISMRVDCDFGRVEFFKNNRMIAMFEDLFACPDSQSQGLRPFMSLACAGDCVTIASNKQGLQEIYFMENSPQGWVKMAGEVVDGRFEGWGVVQLADGMTQFGSFDNRPQGVHIVIPDLLAEDIVIDRVLSYDSQGVSSMVDRQQWLEVVNERIADFQRYRLQFRHSTHPFFNLSHAVDSSSASTTTDNSRLSVRIVGADGLVSRYSLSLTDPWKLVCEAYALKCNVPVTAFHFSVHNSIIDIASTPQETQNAGIAVLGASSTEGAAAEGVEAMESAAGGAAEMTVTLTAKTRRLNLATHSAPSADIVEEFFPNSTALFIVQVIYEPGATVRNGIEIEGSAALYTLGHKEVVEVFSVGMTSEGIKRYRIGDGWISDKLRGGTEAKVVRMVQERFLSVLPLYKVVRSDGIKARAMAAMTSAEVGFVPAETLLTVDEKRVVADDGINMNNGEVTRLHIVAPAEFAGWISEKSHLVTLVSAEGATPTGSTAREESEKVAVTMESNRRSKIRLMRKTKQSALEGERIYVKKNTVSGSLELSQETFFLWKKSRLLDQHGVHVSENRQVVRATESFSGGRLLVVGSRALATGVHYWEVKVQAAAWGSVFIGVTPLPEASSGGWQGLGFINYRATQAFGHETIYGSYFSAGDTVGVYLDLNKGYVGFFKHGEDFNVGRVVYVNMGVAYRSIFRLASRYVQSTTFYPCIGVKTSGDQVSLENCHWQSERGVHIAKQLENYLQAYTYLSIWEESYRKLSSAVIVDHGKDIESSRFHSLPSRLLYQGYKSFQYKSHTQEVSRQTRAGFVVQFTKSWRDSVPMQELAVKHNLRIGGKVVQRYPTGGQETVYLQGLSGDRVWYSAEASGQKAWYWTINELKHLLKDELVAVADDAQTGGSASIDGVQIEAPVSPPPSSTSWEAFQSALHAHWTVEEDRQLVHQINSCARAMDLNPLQLTFAVFHDCRSVAPAKSEKVHSFDDNHSALEINVRFALLCELNLAASQVLPFVDMNDAESRNTFFRYNPRLSSHSSTTISTTSPCGHNLYPLMNPSRMVYHHLKYSIFTVTKHAFWSHVLEETTQPTAAPPDEYERPDEIREININRIQAQHLLRQYKTQEIELATRLRSSVCGQLQAALESSEPRVFRRAYVHMQDAGQRRAFFVKFTGEGVDDQGGPYRALFQNSCEEVHTVLPLLQPSANALAEVGFYRDKFLFNPAASHQSMWKKLAQFFGKLTALAVRHRIHLPLDLVPVVWQGLVGDEVREQEVKALDVALTTSLDHLVADAAHGADVEELFVQALTTACRASRLLPPYLCESIVRNASTAMYTLEDVVHLIFALHLQSQCQPLRFFLHGLSVSLPCELLDLFTAEEAERLFCGEATLDIAMLQRVCLYEDAHPTDPFVQFFWRALAALSNEEHAMFVNFCSGRARLPDSLVDCMPFKLMALSTEGDADKFLPTARTCFFTLSLPKYSSYEVCLEKLRYAIRNTELMDADFIDRRGAAGWDNLT